MASGMQATCVPGGQAELTGSTTAPRPFPVHFPPESRLLAGLRRSRVTPGLWWTASSAAVLSERDRHGFQDHGVLYAL